MSKNTEELPANPSAFPPSHGRGPPPSRPLVKKRPHRRSPQACDECRLRKRACDAASPCAPCRRASLNCTYLFRRPVPPPTNRIRDLQDHLRLARGWLQQIRDTGPPVPGLDLDECLRTLDFTSLPDAASSPTTPTSASATPRSIALSEPTPGPATTQSSGSERTGNMLSGCDRLLSWGQTTALYGAFSDLSFIMRTVELFQNMSTEPESEIYHQIRQHFTLPFSSSDDGRVETTTSPADARHALEVVTSNPHLMDCFLPAFESSGNLYDETEPVSSPAGSLQQLTVALGLMFDYQRHRQEGCDLTQQLADAQLQPVTRSLVPITVDSLSSLQCLLCLTVFFFSTSRITAAHAIISTACASAARLGLLARNFGSSDADPGERAPRLRTLAVLISLDMLTSLILDLPPNLSTDIIRDVRITERMAEAESQSDVITSAMLRQVLLLAIPMSIRSQSQRESAADRGADMDDIRLLETAHNEFRRWKREVSPLLTSLQPIPEHTMIKRDLETLYNFSQLIIFRTHLHHLRSVAVGGPISMAQSYHALACLKIATTTIANAEKWPPGSMAGSWLAIYTVFSAVMCLVFLIAAHPGTARPSVAWHRARKGICIIASYRCGSNLAVACVEVLRIVTVELKHTVWFDFEGIRKAAPRLCEVEREKGSSESASPQHDLKIGANHEGMEYAADRMLFQAEALASDFGFQDILNMSDSD